MIRGRVGRAADLLLYLAWLARRRALDPDEATLRGSLRARLLAPDGPA